MVVEGIWLNSYPKGVPKTLEYPLKTISDTLVESATDFPEKPAILLAGKNFKTTKITYRELNQKSTNFAKNLYKRLNIRKGDRIALYLPNFPEFIIAYYACQKLGAIVVPLNILFSVKELEYHIRDSGARILITTDVKTSSPSNLEKTRIVKANLDQLEYIIVASVKPYLSTIKKHIGSIVGRIEKLKASEFYFDDFLKEMNDFELPVLEIDPKEDIAMIPYTGGTTGTAKGVMLTHWNLTTNFYAAYHWIIPLFNGLPPKGELKFLAALPLFHLFGNAICMVFAIFLASEIILVPNPRERNFTELLELIDKYKPNFFPFVPTGYIALLNHPKIHNYDLKSIDFCLSAAAPLSVEVMRKFEEISGTTILEGWGLTETSPIASANTPIKRKIGSVGIPIPDTEVAIFDPEDKEKRLSFDQIGELGIKGPQIMKGYWNKKEETENVMNSQGFFLTGDIGRIDKEGFIYIEDRKKDMIIASGYKIFPREIEEYFFQHPSVENCAVIGIPDEYRGEKPSCFVVLKENSTITEEELMEYAKKGLSKYKVPSKIEIRKALPTNIVGKVLKRKLREE
ncbi:long-chain-fatty-acid--CoA ligase [Candidatus Hodarchaeum mangrovi]